MKTNPIHSCLALVFPLTAALALIIQTARSSVAAPVRGSVTGQVSNAATGSYLQGAVVAVEGTTRAATTDREGRYDLSGLSSGPATLLVSFRGLDAQRIPIAIGRDAPTVRDITLTSTIYKLEKFTVAGEREGTARSEAMRRQAPNVVNIISADTFGNRADAKNRVEGLRSRVRISPSDRQWISRFPVHLL